MKGIELKLGTIRKIIECNPENLSLDDILKFSTIEYKKVNIRKKEFVQICKVLGKLIQDDFFVNIDDSQLFFINYSNAISEFDVLTVIECNGKSMILNIEVKSCGDDAENKLEEQMKNRVDNHLQQMFIDTNYLIIGFIEDDFYKAILKRDSEEQYIKYNELIGMKNNIRENENVYNNITLSDNLSNIQNVYKKVKEGTFKLYASNQQRLKEIEKAIEENKKVVLCLAKPGYGKTVLALNIFFNNSKAKMLILNQKFYNTFNMSEFFHSSRAFFGTESFINALNFQTIAIIDEAQRLNEDTLNRIISKSKAVIIFGDTSQAFMPTDEFYSNDLFEECVTEITNGNYKKIKLKESIRYPKEVDIALRYIIDKRTRKDELRKLDNFDIRVYNCKVDFFREYNKISGNKKIFKMYTFSDLSSPIVVKVKGETYTYYPSGRNIWDFAIRENFPGYGHTLHAISFDIENVFLYFDNLYYSETYKMPLPIGINEDDESEIEKYKNEMNILLTRAKSSLHIWLDDLKSFLWFNSKIKDIKSANLILND